MTRRFSPWLKSRVANVCRKTCGPIPLVLIRDFLKYFFTDCSCDACAPISWTACVQREGLALSVWPFAQGSLLAAPIAPICDDVGLRGGRWPRDILLRVAVWVRMVRRRGSSHHRGPPVCYTEVATLRAIDKVSPGPDLDALIAEDVFGWGNVSPRLKSQSRR